MSRNTIYNTARGLAFVSGIFSAVVCVLIIASYLQIRSADPLNSTGLSEMRTELQDRPDDDALKNEIRKRDTGARRAFFHNLVFRSRGSLLLLAGVAITLISLRIMVGSRIKPAHPGKYQALDNEKEIAAFDRRTIIGGGAILVVATLAMSLFMKDGLVDTTNPSQIEGDKKITYASHEQMLKNWPSFRGTDNIGITHDTNAPTSWDGKTGKNIRWKIPNPVKGFNSPIVWENRLFMSGGDKTLREVICIDAPSGKLVWKRPVDKVPGSNGKVPELMEDTGYAPSGMTTDGKRVFAIFPTGDVICHDFSGKRIWARNLGLPVNAYGYASSLVTYQDLLIVQYDNENNPRVMALKSGSGKTAWETPRSVKPSWASPSIVYPDGKALLVLNANPLVCAYDLSNGKELWSLKCMRGEMAPSPTFANGLIFSTTQYAILGAIKSGPTPELIWKIDELLPDVSSPTAYGKYVVVATADADVSCYDSMTGARLWLQEFDDGFYSSPIFAQNRIYLMDMTGTMFVIKASDKYEEISKCVLGEESTSTPAFANGRIYIRGKKHLFCIEKKQGVEQ